MPLYVSHRVRKRKAVVNVDNRIDPVQMKMDMERMQRNDIEALRRAEAEKRIAEMKLEAIQKRMEAHQSSIPNAMSATSNAKRVSASALMRMTRAADGATWLDSTVTVLADGTYSSKEMCSYDDNGNETMRAYYYWDSTASDFVLSINYEYTYNDDGLCAYYEIYKGISETLYSTTTYYYSTHESTQVSRVSVDYADGTTRIYDLQGRPRTSLGKGVNIVNAIGKTTKVVK